MPTCVFMVPSGQEGYARDLLVSSVMRKNPDLIKELYVPMRKRLIYLHVDQDGKPLIGQPAGGKTRLARAAYQKSLATGSLPDLQSPVGRRAQYMKPQNKVWVEIPDVLFPGYLFATLEQLSDREVVTQEIKNFAPDTFFHLVGKKVTDLRDVSEEEIEGIHSLCGDQHVLETSKGIKENGKVRFIAGPLVGHEGDVVFIDRGKRRATVLIKFLGELRKVEVGVEVLSADTLGGDG